MSHRLLIIIVALLLAGCTATRPASNVAECDCQQEVRVPDKAFQTYLITNGYSERVHGSWLRPTTKGCTTRVMNCYNQGIGSLRGIEMFPQLEHLICSDNAIRELDLTVLPRLRSFYCNNVPLRRIDVRGCDSIHYIELGYTELREIDLDGCTEIDSLYCIFSPIRYIDLSPCPRLKTLYIRGTEIETVDLRRNPLFHLLHGQDSWLRTVIITPEQYNADVLMSVGDSVRVKVIPED